MPVQQHLCVPCSVPAGLYASQQPCCQHPHHHHHPSQPPPLSTPLRSIATYRGNYDVFVKTAEERLRNATKAAEAQAAKRAHVQVGACLQA